MIISWNICIIRQRCNTLPQKLFSFLLVESITPSVGCVKTLVELWKQKNQKFLDRRVSPLRFLCFYILIINDLHRVKPLPKIILLLWRVSPFFIAWYSISYTYKTVWVKPSIQNLFKKTMNTENTKETEVAPCGAEAFKKVSDDGQKICSRKL